MMHFRPERVAQVAETEAPSSTIHRLVVHPQRLPCCISELIDATDSHMVMVSERRSMPCLPPSASKPFKTDQSKSDTSTIERPDSPALTASSRRSVSSMKRLLPLRLQQTPPQHMIDLASWLDNSVPNTQLPVASNFQNESREEITNKIPVLWMSSSQDARLSRVLPPDQYRETPIYSGRESPVLARACFGDEDLCFHCLPTGSICDELCIVSEYEDAEALGPLDQDSVVDYADTFDADKIGSVQTSTTSFASCRISNQSNVCNEHVTPDEATWMKSSSRSEVEGGSQEAASSAEINELEEGQNSVEGWFDNESNRSSSSFSSDEVLDALVTKLAPAKAHVVELSKVLQALPDLADLSKSKLQDRPATSYRLSPRQRTHFNYPLLTLKKNAVDDRTARHRQPQRETSSSSLISDLQWEHALHSPPFSPVISTSSSDFERRLLGREYGHAEPDSVELSRSNIDAIYDTLQDFPQRMLFLDTPCIVDIRHQNYLAQCAADPRLSPNPSSSSTSTYSLALDQLQLPSSRRRTATDFFAPFFHATTKKSSLFWRKVTPSYASRPPSSMSTGWRTLASQSDSSPPNLSVFRHIFPNTQDWWRNVLYAHVIAFNYVRENHAHPQRPFRGFPSKAFQTLGISYERSRPTASTSIELADLEEKLVSSITWVTNCMSGKSIDLKDIEKVQHKYDRDHILARALAEILKASEGGGRQEAGVPQAH